MLSNLKIFTGLSGSWSFSRTITNVGDPALSGVVSGTANFTPISNNQLLYEENGNYTTTNAVTMPIHKDYIFAYNPNSDKVEKYFAEGKRKSNLFYVFGDYKHKCGNDFYEATYDFPNDENFTTFGLTYRVSGSKDYVHQTIYTRMRV